MFLAKWFVANRGRWGSSGVLKCELDCVCKLFFWFIVLIREQWIRRGTQISVYDEDVVAERVRLGLKQRHSHSHNEVILVSHLSVQCHLLDTVCLNVCLNSMQVFISISHCVNSAYVPQTQFQACCECLQQVPILCKVTCPVFGLSGWCCNRIV